MTPTEHRRPQVAQRSHSKDRRACALRRCALLSLALVAVVVVLAGGAGIASAAGTPVLSATPSPAAVTYPHAVSISGTLTDDAGGISSQAIELVQRPAGTTGDWLPAGSAITGVDGSFSFRVTPSDSTDYEVRYPAGSATPDAQAGATVTVRPLVTTSFPAGLWLGQTVLLRGRVQPAYPVGTAVSIERKVSGVWQPLVTATLDDTSRFAFRWTPTEFGYYRLRARVDADEKHDAGMSAAEMVIVNRPNAHKVPMRYAHYLVNVRHEYRLYYYEHGVLVRGFDVALGRPGYRTPLGLFRIYGKRKPAGGPLGACAMFYRRQGGIAIHGTDQPYLIRRPIPRDFSHGCTRMLNKQVLWLYARVPVRTYVHNLP